MSKEQIRASNIVQSIIKLKQSVTHMQVVSLILMENVTDGKKPKGVNHFERQIKAIEAIYINTVSIPALTKEVRTAIRNIWNSDEFEVDAIAEKIALLTPAKKEMIEKIVDGLLIGEEITIE
jgi:hypothetical protein